MVLLDSLADKYLILDLKTLEDECVFLNIEIQQIRNEIRDLEEVILHHSLYILILLLCNF